MLTVVKELSNVKLCWTWNLMLSTWVMLSPTRLANSVPKAEQRKLLTFLVKLDKKALASSPPTVTLALLVLKLHTNVSHICTSRRFSVSRNPR